MNKRRLVFTDHWWARYGAALLAVGVGGLARMALTAWVGPNLPPYITFYPVVMLAALLGGFGPGLVATAAAALVAAIWVLPPHGALGVESLAEAVGLVLFSGMGLLMSAAAEALRRSRQRGAACEKGLAVRESQEALRQSEERLRLLGDNLPESAVYQYAHEPDGRVRFLYFSAGIERLNGVRVQDVLCDAAALLQQVLPEYRKPLAEAEARSARDLSDFDMEFPMRRPDGQVRWMRLHSRPRRLPNGRIIWDGVQTDVTERKQAEQALRESEARRKVAEAVQAERQRLNDVLDMLPVAVVLLSPDYRVPFANRFFEQRFGEFHGKRCFEHLFIRTEPCENCETFKVLQNHAPNHWEWSGPDGRYYEIHGFPFPDADGSPLVMVMGIDITERKRSEAALQQANERLEQRVAERTAALRESEARMARAQDIAHLGSWELDLVKNRLSWSEEVYRIFGLEPRQCETTYEAFLAAVHPDDRSAVDAEYSSSVREGRDSYEIEHRVVRPTSGEVRIVHEKCEHFRDESGRIVRSVGMVHDITERKRIEDALRRGEALLTQAVRLAGLGIFEHDHRSDRLEYSPVMRELLGFGKDEPATVEVTLQHVASEDRAALAAAIQRAHDPKGGDGLFDADYRVAWPDGSIRWVSARSQTFFEGEGDERRPTRTIGAVLDVTERKEFQARLERLVAERTAKLQELVGELEHFSYTITHDMRAPLRAMKCFSEMANEQCAGCSEQVPRDYLRRITTSAARMDALITDALNYSMAVRQEPTLKPVDPAALLRGMLDSYPELQPAKARIQIQGKIPWVMGNEAGLTQCFSNLLGNAVKFVKPGQIPHVRIWAETRGSMVRMWFEDNGIGIPNLMQSKVFDMFSRGSTHYEGTGIGLALVRKVMERMGGKVGVESEEGKGSRFWLELKPGDGQLFSES